MLARCGATSGPTWSALSAGLRLAKHVQLKEVPDVLSLCIASKRALSIQSLGAFSIEAGSGSQHQFATCVVRGRASFTHVFVSAISVGCSLLARPLSSAGIRSQTRPLP